MNNLKKKEEIKTDAYVWDCVILNLEISLIIDNDLKRAICNILMYLVK